MILPISVEIDTNPTRQRGRTLTHQPFQRSAVKRSPSLARRVRVGIVKFRAIAAIGVFLLIGVLPGVSTRADEPSLTELVGADVGLSIEVHGLKQNLSDLPNAEWFRRLTQLPFVQKWQQGPEFAKWQAGKTSLETMIGQPLDRFAAELLGESMLVAFVPSESGKPDAVLLSRAERDDSWDRALKLWDQLEPHDVQKLSASGNSFQRRRKKAGGKTTGPEFFTAQLGRTLAISESEGQIRSVLARAEAKSSGSRTATLANLPQYRQAMESVPAASSIRVFVNPRMWDAEFRRAKPSEAWVAALWQRLEWLSLGVELRDGITFHAVVHHQTGEISDVWQRVVQAAQEKSDLAARLPANALLAGELRFDPQLLSWLRTLDQSEKSQSDWQRFANVSRGLLGRDLFADVLPHFRPQLGGAIVPSETLKEQAAPVNGLLAWEFSAPQNADLIEGQPGLRESLDGAMLVLMNLMAVSHNSRDLESAAVPRRIQTGETMLRWLEGLNPYRPAYGLSANQLLVATDPQLITSLWQATPARSLSSEPLFSAVRSRYFADQPQWMFANCSAAKRFVTDNHQPLSRQLAYWRKIDESVAGRHLDRLVEILTPFDAVFSAVKLSEGEVRCTAGFVTPTR